MNALASRRPAAVAVSSYIPQRSTAGAPSIILPPRAGQSVSRDRALADASEAKQWMSTQQARVASSANDLAQTAHFYGSDVACRLTIAPVTASEVDAVVRSPEASPIGASEERLGAPDTSSIFPKDLQTADGRTAAPSGAGLVDAVLKSFASSITAALKAGPPPDQAVVEHILDGVRSYMQRTFGNTRKLRSGGLAPWQVRRAKEMMTSCDHPEPSIGDLAAACGLSVAHFSKAFRQSCGTTPHRWLMTRRLERVRSMLQDTDIPLASIAVECGFADQAHLTNSFSKKFGAPPGAMRRLWRTNTQAAVA